MKSTRIEYLLTVIIVCVPVVVNAETHQSNLAEIWYGNSGNLRLDDDQTIERLGSVYEISRDVSAGSGVEPDRTTPEGPRDGLRHGLAVLLVQDILGKYLGPIAVWAASQEELRHVTSEVVEWHGNSGFLIRRNLGSPELTHSDRRHLNDVYNNSAGLQIWNRSGGNLGVAIGLLAVSVRNSARSPNESDFIWNNTDRLAPKDRAWATNAVEMMRGVIGDKHADRALQTIENNWPDAAPDPTPDPAPDPTSDPAPGCVGEGCEIGGPARLANDEGDPPDILDLMDNGYALNEWLRSIAPQPAIMEEIFGDDGVEPYFDEEKFLHMLSELFPEDLEKMELTEIILTSDTNGELKARLNVWLRSRPRMYEEPIWERIQHGWTDPAPPWAE